MRELGLIGRVGRIKLASKKELIDRRRDVVRIRAPAKKGEHLRSLIFGGELLEVAHQRRLVEGRLDRKLALIATAFGDGIEERIERGGRNRLEHRSDLFFRMR